MDVKLKVHAGKHAGKLIPILGPKFLIGRADDCHLQASSDLISRHHCAFIVGDSYVGIRDFGSKNGTFVNDAAIDGEQELHSGDVVRVGQLEFEIVADVSTQAKKRPPVKSLAEVAQRSAEGSRLSSDDDIAQWLGQPDQPESGQWKRTSDTRTVIRADGDTISAGFASSDESATASSGGKHASKGPGKLPKAAPEQSKDSREAAANVLKQLSAKQQQSQRKPEKS